MSAGRNVCLFSSLSFVSKLADRHPGSLSDGCVSFMPHQGFCPWIPVVFVQQNCSIRPYPFSDASQSTASSWGIWASAQLFPYFRLGGQVQHSPCAYYPLKIPSGLYPPSALANIKPPPIIHAAINWIKRQMPYLDPKDLLPISIEVFKLAIVCGNSSTPSLMVAECHRADGTFGIVRV